MNHYSSPYYLTFLQAKERNAQITKGAKGNLIVFWKMKEVEEGSETKEIPFIRFSYVFNLSQTTLHSEDYEQRIMSCEEIIDSMIEKPIIKNNTLRCCYSPNNDFISLPSLSSFNKPEEYYSTLFHELIHWTGASKRLNRFNNSYEHEEYSFEELTAEIGSSYLCAMTGISPKVINNQSAYISNWLTRISTDENIVIKASAEAKRAVEFVINSG